jgi:hypothetical protein
MCYAGLIYRRFRYRHRRCLTAACLRRLVTPGFLLPQAQPRQQKYRPYDRELLAVYEAIKYF